MSRFDNIFGPSRLGDYLALVAGAALPFAFAPFNRWPIAFFSPVLLLACLLQISAKRSFWRGCYFGVGLFTVGASWIYISIHTYGNAPVSLSVFITALFIFVLSLFYALQCYCFKKLCPQSSISQCWLAFPAMWALFEWVRTWALTGFPWLFLGNSQLESPLKGFAPIVSVYGVSFFVCLISAAIMTIFIAKKIRWRLLSIGLIAVVFVSGWGLSQIHWTQPEGNAIQVSLVQGNIPQEMKWDPKALNASLQVYENLTHQHWQSKIIIWPEAAISALPQDVPDFIANMKIQASEHHRAILTGIPLYENGKYYNALITLGDAQGRYLKRHLVPFGEYLPFHNILGILLNYLKIPMSDFSAGPKDQANITANGLKLSPFICYEIAYPQEVRNAIKDANAIVVITDDSWFGKSIAASQHLQIAQMRALETGRFLLNDTNNGITAIINPQGQITQQIPHFKEAVLTGNITSMTGRTPWMILGVWPIVVLLLLLVGFAAWYGRMNKT